MSSGRAARTRWGLLGFGGGVGLAAAGLALAGSQLGLLLLVLVVQAALFLYVRRIGALLGGRVERLRRQALEAEGSARERDEGFAADLASHLVALRSDVETIRTELGAVSGELRDLDAQIEELSGDLGKASRDQLGKQHLRFALRRQYDQVDALHALYHELRPVHAFPPMGAWAASPDLLRFLVETIRTRTPQLVVECGSGVSTLVMAYALERWDAGRIVALEHLEPHHAATEALVAHHGLSHRVDLRLAPLKDVTLDGASYPWYDPAALPSGPVDLLFVDGPPGKEHLHARLPAVPLLYRELAPEAMIVLDDHRRDEEREVVATWLATYPEFHLDELKHEKGTAVITRTVAPTSTS